jgi:DNA repair protein RadD
MGHPLRAAEEPERLPGGPRMMMPRQYQVSAIEAVRGQFRAGKRAIVLVSPTGSGKSCMGAMMVSGHVQKSGRVIWLAHRTELRSQAVSTLEAFGVDVGRDGLNPSAPAQVCSIQALHRRREIPEGTMVVVDECHHTPSGGQGWSEIVRAYRAAGATIIGLTATPERSDGQGLEAFEAIVCAAQISELTKLGHLVPLRIKRPTKLLRKNTIAQAPVDAYLEHARGRSAIVFAPHLAAGDAYAAEFRQLGIDADVVTGKTPLELRVTTLGRFAIGRLRVLINVGVLVEGFDSPRCDCVIIARGVGTPGLLIQMAGRALRPHPGKRDALLIDLRGVTHALGRPDADAEYSLSGEGIALTGARAGERMCRVCGLPMGDAVICSECGKSTEMVTPRAVGEKLVDWHEVLAQDPPDKRVARLAKWIREGREKGHKPGAVRFKFRAVYGYHASADMIARAEALLRGGS